MTSDASSTIWTHLGYRLTSHTMLDSQYIETTTDSDGKEIKTILEEGYITPQSVGLFKYEFMNPTDITVSIRKNGQKDGKTIDPKLGRVGFRPFQCTYPDKSIVNTAVLTNVVLQYLPIIKKERNEYGRKYINIGIPKLYIDTFVHQAKVNSNVNIVQRERDTVIDGLYWTSCNLENLIPDQVGTAVSLENGGGTVINESVHEILSDSETHQYVQMTTQLNVSISNTNEKEALDLDNGNYVFSIKPTSIYVTGDANVNVPQLVSQSARAKNVAEISRSTIATGNAALRALEKLKLRESDESYKG